MLRYTAAYLAGVLTIALVVYAAGGRATLASFLIGFIFAAVLLVAGLSSAARLERAGRFLFAVSDALQRDTRRRPAAASHQLPTSSPLEQEVYTALVNMGSTKPAARAAARYGVDNAPAAAGFEQVFKIALNSNRKAA